MQVQSTFVAGGESGVVSCAVCGNSIAISFAEQKPKKVKKVPEVVELNRVNLRTLIDRQNGLFVSVDFFKVGGEKRTLTGRLGVKKFLKGGENKVEADARPYLTMFDVEILQYRTVSLDTATEIRANGKIYKIID